MFVAESRTQAVTTIRPYAEWRYQNRAALGHNRLLPAADGIDVPFEQILADRFIIGSPAECAAEVARYQAVGVEELIMRGLGGPEAPYFGTYTANSSTGL